MSSLALGDTAVVGDLQASQVSTKRHRDLYGATQAGVGAIPNSGTFFIDPSANPTAYTLADGADEGDRVLIIHKGGANVGVITPVKLAGTSTTISMTDFGTVELIWGGVADGWFVLNRDSSATTANFFSGLPVLA